MNTALLLHDVHGAGGFGSGLLHPLTGPDHLVAMVAVGLWGAQLGKRAAVLLPVAFPLVMALGALLGMSGVALPGVEVGIAASALLLGLAVLAEWRAPLPLAVALVAAFAVLHGHAHGTELPAGEDGLRYSAGFVLSTGLLHAAGIAIGLLSATPRGRLLVRALGAAVAAVGAVYLWRSLS